MNLGYDVRNEREQIYSVKNLNFGLNSESFWALFWSLRFLSHIMYFDFM